ncbi:MAG TPA: formate dehydrogenase accessory sulfurtransferase FdhD [Devosia sp.]|nr:formate dehydrogenase accessory sulfurtransferase FdhD [Devosia sp.]
MPREIENIEMSPRFSGEIAGKNPRPATWRVAEEVPVVLLYGGEQFGVMMLSPADIEDFAIGFSLTEGIISTPEEISDVRIEQVADGIMVNVIVPEEAVKLSETRMRSVPGRSSCGLCGAQSLEAAMPRPPIASGLVPTPEMALKALAGLAAKQSINKQNFSMHAAALCSTRGEILLLREDVGRHNALDKLCGAMARAGLSSKDGFLVLTSRFSVELAQKAAAMRFAFVASISAPTALALRVANQAKMRIATQGGNELMVFGD